MKVYEAIFDEEKSEGVYALSVVENPAMEDLWITLSEHPKQIELAAIDEDKRLLLGAALIPNKKIYRNIDGNEFYITFKEDTIEKLAHTFFKKQHNNNSSLEHEIKLEGMSVVEAWIVEDPKNDKSNLYGKEYEKGTWVTMMKVDNDEVWQKAKNGEIKGFSIDGLLGLKPIELKQINSNMNTENQKSLKDDILDGIKAFLTSNKEEKVEVKAEEVEVVEETIETPEVETKEEFDAEAFARELKETLSVEFKEMLNVELSKKDDVIAEKTKEIETLKAELSKEPEVNPVKSKPEVKNERVELNQPTTTHSRAFGNIAKTMNWN